MDIKYIQQARVQRREANSHRPVRPICCYNMEGQLSFVQKWRRRKLTKYQIFIIIFAISWQAQVRSEVNLKKGSLKSHLPGFQVSHFPAISGWAGVALPQRPQIPHPKVAHRLHFQGHMEAEEV